MQTCYYEGSYEEIVQAYIEYYHKRASRCKWFYYSLNILKIGLVVSIPVLQSIDLTKKLCMDSGTCFRTDFIC